MTDDLPPVLRWEYNRADDPAPEVSASHDQFKTATWESKEIKIERDAARQALQDIHERIEERSKYWVIEGLVLGAEPYIDADVFCRCAYETPLEQVLDVSVTVVPGETIAPVIPNRKRVEEHVFAEDTDD